MDNMIWFDVHWQPIVGREEDAQGYNSFPQEWDALSAKNILETDNRDYQSFFGCLIDWIQLLEYPIPARPRP